MKKKIVCCDLFCGAGGASTGMIHALQKAGVKFDLIGVNHWNIAIKTHKMNYDFEKLYCSTVQNVKPREAVPGGRLHFLWASPECTNHSRAKGGRPKDDQSRSTAWDVLKWAQELYIDRIYIENVVEFLDWGPIDSKGSPIKSKRGQTFLAWVAALQGLGYTVDWQKMNAADYGAPTSRERLIIQAVRGKNKIIWCNPTHAKTPGLFGEKKWRSAAEIIDWSIQGRSIFDRKKPLAENTIRRIAAGIKKYWGDWAEPFLLILRGTKNSQIDHSSQNLSEPLPTITAGGGHIAVIEPFLLRYNKGSDRHHKISDPVPVMDCSNRYGLVTPSLQPLFIPQQSAGSAKTVESPLPTISTAGAISIVEPFLIKFYGCGQQAKKLQEPLDTITTKDRFGLINGNILKIGDQTFFLDIRFRMLQPHELAAGMGFPKDYLFAGSKKDQVKQIGNAVSPNLSEALISSALSA